MLCMLLAIAVGAVLEKFISHKWLFIFSGCLFVSLAGLEVYKMVNGDSAGESMAAL